MKLVNTVTFESREKIPKIKSVSIRPVLFYTERVLSKHFQADITKCYRSALCNGN